MNPNKQANSSWLSTLLMIGIMAFGGSAAFFVLSGNPDASKKPEPTAGLPAVAPAPVTAAPIAAPTAAPVAAPAAVLPNQPSVAAVAAAPSPAPVPAAIAAKAASTETSSEPEPKQKAAVKLKIKAQPVEAVRRDKRNRTAKSAESVPAVRDLPVAAGSAEAVAPATVSETKTPPSSAPVVDFKPVPAVKASPAKDTSSEPKASHGQGDVDPEKPVVKKLHAPPLVPATSKPVVVLTSGDKAWVRVDEQKTVVVSKGQELPGLGAYRGTDGKNAKFDSGVLPVTP